MAADRESRCPWCGGSLAGAGRRDDAGIVCPACGVTTTDPAPSDAELERAYAGWYRPATGRFAGPGDMLLRWSRGRLARRLDRIAPPGRVLDVGAGEGVLVAALEARGRAAMGIERKATHPGVRATEIGEIDGEWAAVVFWHALEHLREPGAALEHAARLLAEDGVIVVAMPNAGSLQARAFGERWLALDIPRHLVHVPAGALVARLRALGLRVERVGHLRGGQVVFGWLHGFVGTLPGRMDLYDAIRRPEARRGPLTATRRASALALAAVLSPVAALAALVEAGLGRGGSVYVEARRG